VKEILEKLHRMEEENVQVSRLLLGSYSSAANDNKGNPFFDLVRGLGGG
jgi:hypothetical protein